MGFVDLCGEDRFQGVSLKAHRDDSEDCAQAAVVGEEVRVMATPPATELTVELTVDADQLRALLTEMHTLVDELPPWMRWLAFQAFEHIDHSPNLVPVDGQDCAATPARRCIGRLEPSKDLVLFVTALRACKGDGPSRVEFEGDIGA